LNYIKRASLPAALLLLTACASQWVSSDDEGGFSVEAFQSPPSSAKPRVWWHWMNGNVTPEGISKDLQWMKSVGIGGVQMFDAALDTPIIVEERVQYMSPTWKQYFAHAVDTASELDLEFAVASSAGWSLTGGPWVNADDGMKKLVWSETVLHSQQMNTVDLPRPNDTVGAYQDLTAEYKHAVNLDAIPQAYYRDIAVLAYPVNDIASALSPTKVLVNGESVDAAQLLDSGLNTGLPLPQSQGKTPASLEYHFAEPVSIAAAELFVKHAPKSVMQGALAPMLQAWINGHWKDVSQFRLGKVPTTLGFPGVTSDKFRVSFVRSNEKSQFSFSPEPGLDFSGLSGLASLKPKAAVLAEFKLFTNPKIDQFEAKAGFELVNNYNALPSNAPNSTGIDPNSVRDVSAFMDDSGSLNWEAPDGTWKIIRLGYSLTGQINSPAPFEATGLEVDKLDGDAVRRYMTHYLSIFQDIMDEQKVEAGLNALLTDSIEAGPANWTPDIPAHFEALRGYNLMSWLPALTGEIVGSREQSEQFLNDYRRTLAELVATEHYGTVAEVAHEFGLVVYGESLEGNRIVSTLGDEMEMRRFADIPMAAMWSYKPGGKPNAYYEADMKSAASVAHIYGKKLVAAESLTSMMSPFAHTPEVLQPMIDAEFLNGINRPVIHTSVHQPLDDKFPGLSLNVFGQYFTRHETWAPMAKPWIDYLARNSYLLQQGKNVADVAYFYGEEPSISIQAAVDGLPADLPEIFPFDYLSPNALLNEVTVRNGNLVTPGGASYKALQLGAASRPAMSFAVLSKIAELVNAGGIVIGRKPLHSAGQNTSSDEFQKLVNMLWSGNAVTQFGKGQVFNSQSGDEVLSDLGMKPGLSIDKPSSIRFVQRNTETEDIFYIANRGSAQTVNLTFQVSGKVPTVWHADSGRVIQTPYQDSGSETTIALAFNDWESKFIVFSSAYPEGTEEQVVYSDERALVIDGPWTLNFEAGRGAPKEIVQEQLAPLSTHQLSGVKYFSGITHYSNSFMLSAKDEAEDFMLEFDHISDVAEVLVNGKSAGVIWKKPYRIDISDWVVAGENTLEVRVANRWKNRLIGDRQPGVSPVTYTTFNTYLPNAELDKSGLDGQVRLITLSKK
jgi:hypothetical protein